MSKALDLLTKGLNEGYTGKTVVETTERGGFTFKKSHFENSEGIYHDEWLPVRTGGGQELVSVGEEKYTRLYAGGVIASEELEKLGITEKEVIGYLMKKVSELGDKTRLFKNCIPGSDGEWHYQYKVTDVIESINLTRSIEAIVYKNTQVFIHGFEICRVAE